MGTIDEYVAPTGFYVVINKYYTATVRNIRDFTAYLDSEWGKNDIDLEVFGEIKNIDYEARDDFRAKVYEIIAEIKGFATFTNRGNKHQFIECTDDVETISIRTKGGKKITVCVMEVYYSKCVDIKYHSDKDKFTVMGFDGGKTPIKQTEVTLMTMLMSNN
jgi:hypothetical protein